MSLKIGILSDTHGRTGTILAALTEFEARGVELLIHCGDIDNAEAVRVFDGWDTHFVYGNCDGDRLAIRLAIAAIGCTLHEPFGHLQLVDKQIAWLHGDRLELMNDVEHSDAYDYLFYGHTHVAEHHITGKTQVINPGALFRAKQKTCLVLDLPSGNLEPIALENL